MDEVSLQNKLFSKDEKKCYSILCVPDRIFLMSLNCAESAASLHPGNLVISLSSLMVKAT